MFYLKENRIISRISLLTYLLLIAVMQEELHYSSNGNSIIADEGNEECTLSKKQSKHLQGAVNDNSVNMRTICKLVVLVI